jgi:hypothetical protein
MPPYRHAREFVAHKEPHRADRSPKRTCLSAVGQRHRWRTGRSRRRDPADSHQRPASPRSVSVTDGAQAAPRPRSGGFAQPTCLSAVGQRHRRRTGSPWPNRPASPRSVSVTDGAQAAPGPRSGGFAQPTCLSALGQRHRRRTGSPWPNRPASPRSVSVTDDAQAGLGRAGRRIRANNLPLRGRSASPTAHSQVLVAPVDGFAPTTCLSAVGQRHRRRTGRSWWSCP